MILANVIFGPRRQAPRERLEDIAEGYVCSLFHSGQLCGEYFLTWTKGILNAHVALAGRGAWALRYHSPYGREELKKVEVAFGQKPQWKVLDDEERRRTPTWKASPFLYLFTHAFDWTSPICRGDGKGPVPVFLLPIPFEQKDGIRGWQNKYRLHDQIWLEWGALEIAAYRQLADPDSALSQEGRDRCREVETATGAPTFYFLKRYWGRLNGEDERLCPGCGRLWKTATIKEERQPFWKFDFCCDRCRLVSHRGVSTDGGRRTRIGEYRGHGKKPIKRHADA
jgi:predicted  nucleic acid-binding Zn ribbon protein